MAGHSKWANIKHKKAANDKKRGQLWSKLIREITVAARQSQTTDPNTCPRLRLAVDKGLAANMPKETIERACRRGAGAQEGGQYQDVRYEGYGPGGVAVMVDCLTDNRNRSVAEVRHVFSKAGGSLGTGGSVAYLFKQRGIIRYEADADEEKIMEVAAESGADDVLNQQDVIEVITQPSVYLGNYILIDPRMIIFCDNP